MAVRSLSKKDSKKPIEDVLAYISKPLQSQEFTQDTIFWNMIEKHTLQATIREFKRNARHIRQRKNGNIIYHEIISLKGDDVPKGKGIAILHDLARHYLGQRAQNALAVGKVHLNSKHPHIHLVISANERRRAKKLHMTKAQFQRVKRDLERYKRREYPYLTPVNHQPHAGEVKEKRSGIHRPTKTRGEREQERRTRKPSRKETTFQGVLEALSSANSMDSLTKRLRAFGLKLYTRGKQSHGVHEINTGRKYRLKTLGLLQEFEWTKKAFDRIKNRKAEIETITHKKEALKEQRRDNTQELTI